MRWSHLAVFALVVAISEPFRTGLDFSSQVVDDEWTEWKLKHGVSFAANSEEDLSGKMAYMAKKAKIAMHNARFYRGQESFRMDMTDFPDLNQSVAIKGEEPFRMDNLDMADFPDLNQSVAIQNGADNSFLQESMSLDSETMIGLEWQTWMLKHDKSYPTTEELESRLMTYMETRQMIARHNARYYRGEETWTMGMNQFGDMRSDEIPDAIDESFLQEILAANDTKRV